MYLMHHEGEGNGPLFIRDELLSMGKGSYGSAQERLRGVFRMQVRDADKIIQKASGDISAAYRFWLSNYIDSKINLKNFTCSCKEKIPKRLSAILVEVNGKFVKEIQ